MLFLHDSDGLRLPIKLDATSNGEFLPIPLEAVNRKANDLAHKNASANARKLNLGRRKFLVSCAGAASTLLAFNTANANSNRTGGFYDLSPEAALDAELASEQLAGNEFVFDVQGHFVGKNGFGQVGLGGADQFIKDIFIDSDTDMMVLSFIPSRRENELLTISEAIETQRIIDAMAGSHRLLLQGRVNPNQPGDMEDMDELVEHWGVSAIKTFTQWGPDGEGFYLHDDLGVRLIEKARRLGVRTICIHKGLPFNRRSYKHSIASDVGVAAKLFPDVNFVIYHSGFIAGEIEGPYDPNRGEGIDALIKSVVDNAIPKGGNVFAELGSTWRYVMRNPDMAAHVIGKLVQYLGEDNVLYGSDCIWYGSPQDQIQAFRAFQISQEFQERYGYAELTSNLRAKIFGLNAARVFGIQPDEVQRRAGDDFIGREKANRGVNLDPHYLTFGPKTKREFLALQEAHQLP